MDLQLRNKSVLITGGSKGIGLECARVFLQEGARVAIASRDADNLRRAATALKDEGFEVATFTAELRDPASAQALARSTEAALSGLDILVNCAGAAVRTPPDELTAAHWHAAMDAKYFTYIHAIDAVLPGMVQRGGGVIVNVVGMGGKHPHAVHLPGGSANAALMLASAGLANAYAGKNIRVVAVNPASTVTERLKDGIAADARLANISPEAMLAKKTAQHPMGRLAEPREIADVVVFIASKRASYVNGAVISMDGGATPSVV